jgi:alkyldihydroxyacetonephosphate synthase
MPTDNRLKFFGWGLEGTGLNDAERGRLFEFLADRLNIQPHVSAVPKVHEIILHKPRIRPTESIAHLFSGDRYERLVHTYGKSYPEAVRAFSGDFSGAPDLVAFPRSEADVSVLLDWASSSKVAIIPFGCGSSVVGGVGPMQGYDFTGVVSLDLRNLDQVLEIDTVSRAARIQCGIRGPQIEAALKGHNLSLRHYPQSFEFSTLGGWIATRSGGHYATLYTHIDDFVESLRVIAPSGVFETRRLPGSGAGPSPDRLMIGSEGALGVITEAWMRLQHRPIFKGSATFGFPDLFAAAKTVRAVAQAGLYPSNLRVIDNNEAGIYGINDYTETLLFLAFESADHPVDAWLRRGVELIQDLGGRKHVDDRAAAAWRTAFIRMPYARELTVGLSVINDTFESAVTWDNFETFHATVTKAALGALQEATGASGTISTRFTHVYPDGPAPYYTFNVKGKPGHLIEQWQHIKVAASDAVLAAGGTITHHHAVGRDHMPWYLKQRPQLFGEALTATKRTLDPASILNPGVLVQIDQRPKQFRTSKRDVPLR